MIILNLRTIGNLKTAVLTKKTRTVQYLRARERSNEGDRGLILLVRSSQSKSEQMIKGQLLTE